MSHDITSCSSIRICMGQPIENRSEYECLLAVHEVLMALNEWSYIFVNFHVEGRQIDLAVFTATTILVIEAKGYSLPVTGEINGPWLQHGPFGGKKIRNAYNQALDGKYALRNAIQKVTNIDSYPNASVIIAPNIPKGSRLTIGDFKVHIGGLELVPTILQQASGANLTFVQCEKLAEQLGLEFILNKDAVLNRTVLDANRMYDIYTQSFLEFYESYTKKIINDKYNYSGEDISLKDVNNLVTKGDSGLIILGPSGCGKTLLTLSCAVSCIKAGYFPMVVAAKDFSNNFQNFLDKEMTLLHMNSAISIINSAKILGKRIIIFLDGYNECSEAVKIRLTRSLKAFSLRYDARIVMSSQCEPERADLLNLQKVIIGQPSEELKVAILKAENIDSTNENILRLLNVIHSGLEAYLIGKVAHLVPDGASRFVLFDMFAREKLKRYTSEGIRILSIFASVLISKARFSLSVREFDRLCDSQRLSSDLQNELYNSSLLKRRGDKISFEHELFFSSFIAEAVMREANGEIENIIRLLSSPRYSLSKVFILGAIEDNRLLNEVLECVKDKELITACARGECGSVAQTIVNEKVYNLLSMMVEETKGLVFEIHHNGWHGVKVDKLSLSPELEHFDLYIDAISSGLVSGNYFDYVMSACQYIDEAIAIFCEKNMVKKGDISLHHIVFSEAYVMNCNSAFSKLISFIVSGGILFHYKTSGNFDQALYQAWRDSYTFGQYYFLLAISKFNIDTNKIISIIISLIEDSEIYPYHLQLELFYFCKYCRDVGESYHNWLIDVLERSLEKHSSTMNAIIVEAIRDIGGLDKEEDNYLGIIKAELEHVLSSDGVESEQLAWLIYSNQFDHPFESSYWQEINDLDTSKQKLLFMKACRGANVSYSFFLGTLINRLADFNDPSVCSVIIPWTSLPGEDVFSPQVAIEVFVNAHEVLGRLGIPIPAYRGKPVTSTDDVLLACGELYYWINRSDVENPQESSHTLTARQILMKHARCSSIGVLQLTTSQFLSNNGNRKSLIDFYPLISLRVAREMIIAKEEQIFYFQHGFRDNITSVTIFSIQIIGKLGDETDLLLLNNLCDDEKLGTFAFDAIRKIESRLISSF